MLDVRLFGLNLNYMDLLWELEGKPLLIQESLIGIYIQSQQNAPTQHILFANFK
jgi:hypothetical protein